MSGFKREVLFACGYCGRSMVKKNHRYCCRYRTCETDTEYRRAVEDMEKLEGSVMEYVRKTAEVYDKYRSGGMTREQFKVMTREMAVRIEKIGKEMGEAEDGVERLKGCGSRERGGCAGRDSRPAGV